MTQTQSLNADRQLWASVILQALEDASGAIGGINNPSSRTNVRNIARAWFANAGPDFREVCSLAGLEPDAVRTHALKEIEAAGETSAKKVKRYLFEGERLTVKQIAERTGLSPKIISHRIAKGATGAELTKPASNGKRRLTHNGQSLTAEEWAQITGISASTIKRRLKAGWPVEMALTMTAEKSKRQNADRAKAALNQASRRVHLNAKTYTHNGQSKTIDAWAAEIGMSRRTLASRLASGWTIERALQAPVQNKRAANGPGGGSQLPEERGDRRGDSRSIDSRIGNPK